MMIDSDTPLSCPLHPDGAPTEGDGCQACDDILEVLVSSCEAVEPVEPEKP